ncbi:diaminopropionate ammonia-lyase [Rubricella aquisinus]|uniref:Diaminopropionate ammonia-lyase n=1 Tax=Rubricella aquisinus TaxID=2028108 RepID=A0A840X0D2_9RHOB|nr:pyridoxal-phosphate dependent enzyme [Rubricella aquisinus]MBB5516184.1 diaminopropionate ammonia-lyase [Rubricella aquisinus]
MVVDILQNPWRGKGIPGLGPMPADDPAPVLALLDQCPAHAQTPLVRADTLAHEAGIAQLWIKDERGRMGLGSFKALGAAYVIARDAAAAGGPWETALTGATYVTASAGNHGMSVAAGARLFGAQAVVYIAQTVPDSFAERLRAMGARVVREGPTYEDSMEAAEKAARDEGMRLLSDGSWPGYTDPPYHVMEGYLNLAAEAVAQMDAPPTHILLQAGVGGLAAAVAAHARRAWGDGPTIIVVEPEAAPALIESIRAGRIVETEGPVSSMGRLDCKVPSMIALAGLARDADAFVTISEAEAAEGCVTLAAHGMPTSPSGGAGLCALLSGGTGIAPDARVLCIMSEGMTEGD